MLKAVPVALAFALWAGMAGQAAVRVNAGLVAAYDFRDDTDRFIRDRSGVQPLMDFRIKDAQSTRRAKGTLEIIGETGVQSLQAAGKLYNAVQKTGAITIEAWVKPANVTQEGPARMVTLSLNHTFRNFTLGQEKDRYVVRLRTTRTSNNGQPEITTPARTVKPALTHVLYTRDRGGNAKIYINGKMVVAKNIPGSVSNWATNYRLGLANEMTGVRKWEGTYHLVAFYNRALSAAEVQQNFAAAAKTLINPSAQAVDVNAELFETKIAPLLAKHCLECHDPATRKGKLDLSLKATAFAEDTIVPGKSAASALWEAVAKDEMPKKRPPLSAAEKAALKKWIDGGAKWTLAQIDPAVYAHGDHSVQNWIRRLTIAEYVATVRAATGVGVAADARKLLPPDVRADGFSNTAYNLNVDLKHIDAYSQLAGIIVKQMDVRKFARRFTRNLNVTDRTMRPLVESMGKWLLRGPLTEREIVVYRGITTTVVASGGSFDEALGLVIQAMLQSPRFIYRIENQQGDGTAWPVTGYELASRLSYLIWGAPPDEALYQAAAAGGFLASDAQLEAQVKRMLADPRAKTRSLTFLAEWLNLDHLANLRPSKKLFPNWNPAFATDMRAETEAFFSEIVWKQNRPLAHLLNAQVAFLTPRLARHYRMPEVESDGGPARVDLSKVPSRGGLLTQGSMLTVGGDGASMVTRGLFVMHDLLRGVVKDPPPCVDTTPVPSEPGLSQRSIAEKRIANAKCGGCHGKFEPLAFGLEKFDGLGSFFEKDAHGNALREDGQMLIPGEAKPASYKTSAELMDLLAGSDRVQRSITWKLAQFAAGRPLGARDARVIDNIHLAAQKKGGTYASLITAIVLSDLVRTTQTETAK